MTDFERAKRWVEKQKSVLISKWKQGEEKRDKDVTADVRTVITGMSPLDMALHSLL